MDVITHIIAKLQSARVDLSNEKAAQQEIEQLFAGETFTMLREPRLNAQDVPDFFVPEIGLAIEVKLRTTSKINCWRQLTRYAKHEKVKQLLLVTNLSMGLPQGIDGKPIFYLSLGRAWL